VLLKIRSFLGRHAFKHGMLLKDDMLLKMASFKDDMLLRWHAFEIDAALAG
jgi:hypothetical protein